MLLKALLSGLVVAFWASWVGPVPAAEEVREQTVIVDGEAPIHGGDVVQARSKALEDAFRNAVRKVIGTYVAAESVTQNFISLDDTIKTKAEGYIKTYQILAEEKDAAILTLRTKVAVSLKPIRSDLKALGILIESMGNPRVVVRVNEKGVGGEPVRNPVGAIQLKESLRDKGFKVLDSPDAGADFVFLGEGVVENVTSIGATGITGSIVRLSVKALTTNTSEVIASESVRMNGAAPDIDASLQMAYRRAAQRAADLLVNEIAEHWSSQLLNGRDISLRVMVSDYSKLKRFRRKLQQIFGVKHVEQRDFTGHSTLFDTKFTGSPKTLADLIAGADFYDLKVEIVRFASDRLELRVE